MKQSKDKILRMFFEKERWVYALEKGVGKKIRQNDLYLLSNKSFRIELYHAIRDGRYKIFPPHTARIPKPASPGEFRTVYVNTPIDRIILSITNDLLFELCPEMVHVTCKSYQKGIGCGSVVKEVSRIVCDTKQEVIGWKSDLSKYFDSVPLRFIEELFDKIEKKHGKSAIISLLRDYYRNDSYYDENKVLCHKFQSLKQGCSVASFLADALLFHIDEKLSSLGGFYRRYSDDMIFLGVSYSKAMNILEEELLKMQMKLNPKKVEYLSKDKRFRFLGYAICGQSISLALDQIKIFQKEIEKRTILCKNNTLIKAVNKVHDYLYKGNGEFSWATRVLSVCNSERDINTLNSFVMDCIRAVATGKKKLYGLGYVGDKKDYCISAGKGRNVTSNRRKLPTIDGYYTIKCMQDNLLTRRGIYDSIVCDM